MRILYFAWLREKIGLAEEELELPAEVQTVAALMDWLKARGRGYAEAFSDLRLVRCAVDQEFSTPEARIAGAREIALFPPVTGG